MVMVLLKKLDKLTNLFINFFREYKNLKFRKILDVGAGRMCKLSAALAKMGNSLYANGGLLKKNLKI